MKSTDFSTSYKNLTNGRYEVWGTFPPLREGKFLMGVVFKGEHGWCVEEHSIVEIAVSCYDTREQAARAVKNHFFMQELNKLEPLSKRRIRTTRSMSPVFAERLHRILVDKWGASESMRSAFIEEHTRPDPAEEWRCGLGKLFNEEGLPLRVSEDYHYSPEVTWLRVMTNRAIQQLVEDESNGLV